MTKKLHLHRETVSHLNSGSLQEAVGGKTEDASWIGDAMSRRLSLIKSTDPKNIHVENIRSFFGIPFGVAKFFCDVAVKEGVFDKRVGYLCPRDKNVLVSVRHGEQLPTHVSCFICQVEEEDEYEFETSELDKIEIYSLVSFSDSEATATA